MGRTMMENGEDWCKMERAMVEHGEGSDGGWRG